MFAIKYNAEDREPPSSTGPSRDRDSTPSAIDGGTARPYDLARFLQSFSSSSRRFVILRAAVSHPEARKQRVCTSRCAPSRHNENHTPTHVCVV